MMTMPESLADTEPSSRRRRRRREEFPEKMDKSVPWALPVDLASRIARRIAKGVPVPAGDNSPGALPPAVLRPGRPPGQGHPARHARRPTLRTAGRRRTIRRSPTSAGCRSVTSSARRFSRRSAGIPGPWLQTVNGHDRRRAELDEEQGPGKGSRDALDEREAQAVFRHESPHRRGR